MKLILLVEDDPLRAEKIQACIPRGARCIWARSAGVAIGVLKRDTFACVLLDHDLEKEPYNSGLNGQAVATDRTQLRFHSGLSIRESQFSRSGRMHEHGVFARFRYNDLKQAALRRTRALCKLNGVEGGVEVCWGGAAEHNG